MAQELESMVAAADRDQIFSKRKAISALFPYAIFLEQGGHQRMVDAILGAARASYFGKFMWHRAKPYITALFDQQSPPSLDRVIALASPYVTWDDMSDGTNAVARWAAAASAVPYTEEVGQSVVDTLFQIASVASLRSHIPVELWSWVKKQPSLPPVCRGRKVAARPEVVHFVRGLKDIDLLKSFFLLVWSEWIHHPKPSLNEMEISIREDFSGIQMREHRKELMERLDYVLGELDQGFERLKLRKPSMEEGNFELAMSCYKTLRKVLLGVDKEERDTKACEYP
jgi:hypothetical protein